MFNSISGLLQFLIQLLNFVATLSRLLLCRHYFLSQHAALVHVFNTGLFRVLLKLRQLSLQGSTVLLLLLELGLRLPTPLYSLLLFLSDLFHTVA